MGGALNQLSRMASKDKSVTIEGPSSIEENGKSPRVTKHVEHLGLESQGNGVVVDVKGEQVFLISENRKLGLVSTCFLIINSMIGTGIFSTPSGVLESTGSIGVALILWVVGGIFTLCGLMVYLEFGMGIPRSGGNKLERVYRRPRHAATCIFAVVTVFFGYTPANTITFGRYILMAAGNPKPTPWDQRGIAVAVLTFVCLVHAFLPRLGIRALNVLGFFKVGVLLFVVFAGFAALAGKLKFEKTFDNYQNVFEGTRTDAYSYATALLNIIYSYDGWQDANSVLGEIKNPSKTLKKAVPLSVGMVMVLYLLANIAYFAAVPKNQAIESGVTIAGQFFLNVFGNGAATRGLPALLALSALGNVLSAIFASSRVVQELGKEGVLPFSRALASDKPFGAPAGAMLLIWMFSLIYIFGPPAGDAYSFTVNLSTYSSSWIAMFVSGGLLWLRCKPKEEWNSPFMPWTGFTVIFAISKAFLVVVPFVPPRDIAHSSTPSIASWIFPVVGILVLFAGAGYWLLFAKVLPRVGGYSIEVERKVLDDGTEVVRYKHVKHSKES